MGKTLLILIISVLVFSHNIVFGQEDYSTVDKETYELYMTGDWNKLAEVADSAIDHGVDLFYLRMWAGMV